MKSFFCFLISICCLLNVQAQPATVKQWQQTAMDFNNRGDHDNAIIVLQQGLKQFPEALALQQDLTTSLLLKRDFAGAKRIVLGLLNRNDADVVCYQLAGNVLKALEEVKECERWYRQGLKKFPESGPLYSELGELLWSTKDSRAVDYWEEGIQRDPNCAGNYYNAALYYCTNTDNWRGLLYAEIFINMESRSERAAGLKKTLWEQYRKKLMQNAPAPSRKPTPFETAYETTFNKASGPAMLGLSTETLTMIRTRFILDWYNQHAGAFPFRLFDHQRQLLQAGLFEAYDHWLFGEAENKPAYEEWKNNQVESFGKMQAFLFNRVFKVPKGQYYF